MKSDFSNPLSCLYTHPCRLSRSRGALWELSQHISLFDAVKYNERIAKDFCKRPGCVDCLSIALVSRAVLLVPTLRLGLHTSTPQWKRPNCFPSSSIKALRSSVCPLGVASGGTRVFNLGWHFCGFLCIALGHSGIHQKHQGPFRSQVEL